MNLIHFVCFLYSFTTFQFGLLSHGELYDELCWNLREYWMKSILFKGGKNNNRNHSREVRFSEPGVVGLMPAQCQNSY